LRNYYIYFVIIAYSERQRNQKRKIIDDNPETQAKLGTQDTERRPNETKTYNTGN